MDAKRTGRENGVSNRFQFAFIGGLVHTDTPLHAYADTDAFLALAMPTGEESAK
jgi:hypothetical protein